jgi:hypothetical protein
MRPDEDEPPLIDYFVSVSIVSDKAAIIDRYPCDDKSSLPLPASIPLVSSRYVILKMISY